MFETFQNNSGMRIYAWGSRATLAAPFPQATFHSCTAALILRIQVHFSCAILSSVERGQGKGGEHVTTAKVAKARTLFLLPPVPHGEGSMQQDRIPHQTQRHEVHGQGSTPATRGNVPHYSWQEWSWGGQHLPS